MGKPLNLAITCYPTYGGSGVIATELGMAMALRGHRVHFIAYDVPRRLDRFRNNLFFHEVELVDNPVFPHPPYTLALTSKMVDVAMNEKIDLFHVHYAVPHATSAFLAKQILGSRAPKVLTTLHGTDITLVGHDSSYLPVARFSITASDGVTVPSEFLKQATYEKLNIPHSHRIDVIPNFVDTVEFKPICEEDPCGSRPLLTDCNSSEKVLVHVSNFRPVKQVDEVVRVFDLVRKKISSHLILVGDGPERSRVQALVRQLGLKDSVCFLGKQDSIAEILQRSHIFILPSRNESFGLAALEALSCGVPVVASKIEGIPEVVVHGEVGYLAEPHDIEGMAARCIELLSNSELYRAMSFRARQHAVAHYNQEKIVSQFEDCYRQLLGQ